MVDAKNIRLGPDGTEGYEDDELCEHIEVENVSEGFSRPEYIERMDIYCHECDKEFRYYIGVN